LASTNVRPSSSAGSFGMHRAASLSSRDVSRHGGDVGSSFSFLSGGGGGNVGDGTTL
jgi:hypothetical protein